MGGFLLYLWFFKKEALQKYLRDKEAEINTSSSSR